MCMCRDQFHEPEVTKVVYIDNLKPGLIAFVTLAYGPITINSARLMRTIKQESLEYVPPVCGECGHRL